METLEGGVVLRDETCLWIDPCYLLGEEELDPFSPVLRSLHITRTSTRCGHVKKDPFAINICNIGLGRRSCGSPSCQTCEQSESANAEEHHFDVNADYSRYGLRLLLS